MRVPVAGAPSPTPKRREPRSPSEPLKRIAGFGGIRVPVRETCNPRGSSGMANDEGGANVKDDQ